ncbi:MAG TPA: FG-GAP-like repeat-containing protein [Pirellulales bacterium]|jgi:hypothetical protein|nr:FG-GAP-like repeat-containing protein [Pirellulales bacterium]
MLKAHPSSGFSLITISILLTVAALIFTSVLPGKDNADNNGKILNNAKKLERVEEAMRSFMAANGRRPCPADGQYAENTQYFGVEAGTPGICTGNTSPTPNAPLGPDAGTGYVVGGVIPTKTLGLPDEYAYDEYGRRFTYVVDTRATESPAAAVTNNNNTPPAGRRVAPKTHAPGCYNLQQSIKLNGAKPGITIENISGGTIIDQTMYAYISHGASGYGAWPAQGSTVANRINSGSTDVDMQVNAGVDALGVSSTFTYNTTNFTNVKIQKDRVNSTLPAGGTDTGFDDLLWYRPDTKNTCCLGAACLQPGFITELYFGSYTSEVGLFLAVGDVNGDGIPDLIIGASQYVYVVFGTRTGFPDPLLLDNLNGTNGFTLGPTGWTTTQSVAVGDVNGDGIPDLIIGIYGPGYTYVVYGARGTWPGDGSGSAGVYSLSAGGSLINGTQGFRLDDPPGTGDQFGYSVAAGDINGDGYADIIIGAHDADAYSLPTGGYTMGSTFVVFGKSTSGSTFLPTTSYTYSGTSVTPASYTNLMVGETLVGTKIPSGATISSCNGGAAIEGTPCLSGNPIVLSAAPTGTGSFTVATAPVIATATPRGLTTLIDGVQGIRLDSVGNSYYCGTALAVGDINGDGVGDLVIGCSSATGEAFALFGKNSGLPFLASTTYSWTSGASITPASYSDLMVGETVAGSGIPTGTTIASCNGGVNTDGTVCTSSVVLSASPRAAGALYVATAPLATGTGTFIDGTQGVRLDAEWSGNTVAATDFNGDGIADLILDASSYENLNEYVVFGKNSSMALLASTTANGTTSNSTSLALNSYTDIMAGETLSGTGIPAGTIISSCTGGTVCTGTLTLSNAATVNNNATITVATAPLNTGTGTFIDGTHGVQFAGTIPGGPSTHAMTSGDINGDGYADLIASFTLNAGGGNTYVIFGNSGNWTTPQTLSNLLDGTHGFQLTSAIEGEYPALATGDINGDGIPDLILGVPFTPIESLGPGYVYTYFGHKNNPANPWPNPSYNIDGL